MEGLCCPLEASVKQCLLVIQVVALPLLQGDPGAPCSLPREVAKVGLKRNLVSPWHCRPHVLRLPLFTQVLRILSSLPRIPPLLPLLVSLELRPLPWAPPTWLSNQGSHWPLNGQLWIASCIYLEAGSLKLLCLVSKSMGVDLQVRQLGKLKAVRAKLVSWCSKQWKDSMSSLMQ